MINLHFVLCNILIIPVIICHNITANKSKITNNMPQDTLLSFNETQVPSEGGSIIPDKVAVALPETVGDIPSLDKETGKSKIVARKGAGNYTDDITKSAEKTALPASDNVSIKPNVSLVTSKPTNKQMKSTKKNISVQKDVSITLNNNPEIASKPIELPKKPLILNADLLAKATPEVKSSPGTIVHNQLQSPNSDVKSYITNVNSHPGMVMPIVITILLVPMFAVLGYMALRRGQEAWKNRHYKRMDFLLDGMYND